MKDSNSRKEVTSRTKTHMRNAMDISGDKAMYDQEVKNALCDRQVLARILKETTKEFKAYDVDTIEACIEEEPEVSAVSVIPGKTNRPRITGMPQEDGVVNEGEITFDIRFYALTPEKEPIKLIINVEAQKKYNPGYNLVSRGIFYGARMISAQLDTEFTAGHYDDIKKVYSIWICMDVPGYAENTITEYKMEQNKVYGDFKGYAKYDLLSVIMVCLGKDVEETDGMMLHGLLKTILSEKLQIKRKEEILQNKYGIRMTEQIERSLMGMCNLSDLIEERGIAKGHRIGMIDSRVEIVMELLGEYGDIPESVHQKICSETDLEILSRWIKLASRVESVEEFAEAM